MPVAVLSGECKTPRSLEASPLRLGYRGRSTLS